MKCGLPGPLPFIWWPQPTCQPQPSGVAPIPTPSVGPLPMRAQAIPQPEVVTPVQTQIGPPCPTPVPNPIDPAGIVGVIVSPDETENAGPQ